MFLEPHRSEGKKRRHLIKAFLQGYILCMLIILPPPPPPLLWDPQAYIDAKYLCIDEVVGAFVTQNKAILRNFTSFWCNFPLFPFPVFFFFFTLLCLKVVYLTVNQIVASTIKIWKKFIDTFFGLVTKRALQRNKVKIVDKTVLDCHHNRHNSLQNFSWDKRRCLWSRNH